MNRVCRLLCLLVTLPLALPASGQEAFTVSGVVIGADDGRPVPGANVVVKGTTIGTTTDAQGAYRLRPPTPMDTLVVSFVGYERQEIPIQGRAQIDVTLQLDVAQLGDVVVVGFGTRRRASLSGSVDHIDASQLETRPVSSLSQGLQGMVPNLNVDFLEGTPGAVPRINVRGFTSINEGDPLILIDGIPSDPSELTRLDPQDVESVSVLKDASSAAIYGARAAFGVILIETKRGSREGIHVRFASRTSIDAPTILPAKTTDPYVYMRLQDIATSNTPWDYFIYSDDEYAWARARSDNPDETPAVREDPNNPGQWQYMGNRDWSRYFLADYGTSTNNVLSIDGSTERTRFYISGAYDTRDGALQLADDRFTRWSVRSNVEYTPRPWLTVQSNSVLGNSERVMPARWPSGSWAMWDFYSHAPMAWDKNPDGTWANTSVGHLAAQLTEGGDLSDERAAYQTSVNVSAEIVENRLTLNADYSIRRELRNYNFDHRRYRVGFGPDDVRELGSTLVHRNRTTHDYEVLNLYSDLSLGFGKHLIGSVLGYNQEFNERYAVVTERANVIASELPSLSLATGDPSTWDDYVGWAVRGAFFRLNYNYDYRYILEFNGRYDGSSRFPKGDRYGFFPSASAAWNIAQEPFMERFAWLDLLKIRASYGSLGNQSVDPFGYIPAMTAGRAPYIVGDARPLSISAPGIVSSNYGWEQVSTRNLGVDVDLFDNRVSAAFDVYVRETKDMLTLGRELPRVLGTSEPLENAADLETKGWELALSYRDHVDVAGDRLSFGVRFSLADSRSWITQFDNSERVLSQYYEGQEIGEIWGLRFEGLFQSEEEIANHADQSEIIPWGALPIVPGWPKFRDLDGDGRIRAGLTVDDPGDLAVIGNTQPRYRFGASFDVSWMNVDVNAFFQGVGKRDYYPRHYLFWGFYQQPYDGGYTHLFDFYRASDDPEELRQQHSRRYIELGLADANTDATYPVLQAWLTDVNTEGVGRIPNTGYMLDASYLRLKSLTVGYTVPRSLTRGLGVRTLRVYAAGENLAEWSELRRFIDPEAITDDGAGYRYPFQRSYALGVTVDF